MFKCAHEGCFFSSKSTTGLARHTSLKHMKSNLPSSFECNCGKKFNHQGTLKNHLKHCLFDGKKEEKSTQDIALDEMQQWETFQDQELGFLETIHFPPSNTHITPQMDVNEECCCKCPSKEDFLEKLPSRDLQNIKDEVAKMVETKANIELSSFSGHSSQESQILWKWYCRYPQNTAESMEELLKILSDKTLSHENFPSNFQQLSKSSIENAEAIIKEVVVFKDPELKFVYTPLLLIIQTWLLDAKRYAQMKFTFIPKINNQNERIYADIWDSDWMKIKQQQLQSLGILEPKIIPLILWSDGTAPAAFSKLSVHPIVIACGSDSLEYRDSDGGKDLVGFIPHLFKVNRKNKKANSQLSVLRLHLFHHCLNIVLHDLKIVETTGFFFKVPDGVGGYKYEKYYPLLCCYLGDTPEQKKVACKFSGGNDKLHEKPCFTCDVSGKDLNEILDSSVREKKILSKSDHNEKWNTLLQCKSNPEYAKLSSSLSMHLERSLVLSLEFFDVPTDLPLDVDHHLSFGIGQFMVDYLQKLLQEMYGQQGNEMYSEIIIEFENICFEELKLPRYLFPNDISDIMSKEKTMERYKWILKFLAFATFRYFKMKQDSRGKLIWETFVLYYKMQRSIYQKSFSESEIQQLMEHIENFCKLILKTFAKVHPSAFATIKFHRIQELYLSIFRFGRPRNTNTGRWEATHKTFVKKVYKSSNKQIRSVQYQMMKLVKSKETKKEDLKIITKQDKTHSVSKKSHMCCCQDITKDYPPFEIACLNFFKNQHQDNPPNSIGDVWIFKSLYGIQDFRYHHLIYDYQIFSVFKWSNGTNGNIVLVSNKESHPWFARCLFIFKVKSWDEPLVFLSWLEFPKNSTGEPQHKDLTFGLYNVYEPKKTYWDVQPISVIVGRVNVISIEKKSYQAGNYLVVE